MDKEKVIEYVMNSPQNTNRAILESMLDSITDTGSSVVFATLNLTDMTEATCSLSHDEIETELQKKTPVILSWAYKPDDAPFYVLLGSSFVEEASGTLSVKINNKVWVCQSDNIWEPLN